MRIKKRLLTALLAVLLLFAAGCSETDTLNRDSISEEAGYAENDAGYTGDVAEESPDASIRKIIKNGTLDLEAQDVAKTYADILSYAQESGGYEFSRSESARDDYVSITAEIKISPDKLDLLMNYAGNTASVINSSTSSDDITEEYYDIQTRLETKQKVLLKYYEFLEKAAKIEDALLIQDEINDLTEEIEAAQGKLKLWDMLVSESTLKLTISQINDPLKPSKDIQWNALSWGDMGTLIKSGFISVSNVLVSALQWFLIIIIAASPLIIIAGIVLLVIRRKGKGHKNKKQAAKNSVPRPSGDKPDSDQPT